MSEAASTRTAAGRTTESENGLCRKKLVMRIAGCRKVAAALEVAVNPLALCGCKSFILKMYVFAAQRVRVESLGRDRHDVTVLACRVGI